MAIKLSSGKWIAPKDLCTVCKDGEFKVERAREINHLKTLMKEVVWICDKCGNKSIRRRSIERE